jgi:hypothetical protein
MPPVPKPYQLTVDWTGSGSNTVYCVLPTIGNGIKWVEYVHSLGYDSITNITQNGAGDLRLDLGNRFLLINTEWIETAQREATNGSVAWSTLTVWYDDARTVGTRWNLGTGKKMEIYPPGMTMPFVTTVTLSNGTPGASYVLESAFPGSPGGLNLTNQTTDTNGVTRWAVAPDVPCRFVRARLVSGGP